MPAIGYLRRSRVDTRKPGAMSHQQQREAIERLAAVHGDDPASLVWIEDWGRSGRAEKQHLRDGFARVEKMVGDGDATVIYSYSANRLARSLETLARLAKSCEVAGVPIRCADGYSPDVSTSTGRMVLGILGSVYAWQADWTSERMTEATAIRRANGHHVGPAPYGTRVVDGILVDNPDEDIEVVKATYRETGAFQATARTLTRRKVPTRTGKPWAASSVRDMLEREAPEILPVRRKKGKVSSSFRFSGLLRCPHDGVYLTGRTYRGKYVAYACRKAATAEPRHPHPHSVAESAIVGWLQAEAARFEVPFDQVAEGVGLDRDAYEAHRKRIIVAFMDGLIDRDERDERLEALAEQAERVTTTMIVPSGIDWTWPPSEINTVLRTYWRHVELGEDLLPVSADWRVPAEYLA